MVDRTKFHNYSGGAAGSDLEWDRVGRLYGFNNHTHFHFTNQNNYQKPKLYILSQDSLNEADSYLKKANLKLKRKFPASSNYVNNLLRRNYYQVINSEGIFAIGTINSYQTVNGGTGWAVELGKLLDKSIFVFDQDKDSWFTWNYKDKIFDSCEVPILSYTYAGIGTREIRVSGKENIGLVYKKTLRELS